MPNLGGAGDRVRRLYTRVVQSIALYGAPAWHDKVWASRKSSNILRGAQRRLALRVMRGYRTIPYEAACAVSGLMPWHLTTALYSELYRVRGIIREGQGNDGNEA